MPSEKENLEEYLEIAAEELSAEQIKLSSEEDLQSLLKLAEDLKDKIEKPESKIRTTRLFQIWYVSFLTLFVILRIFDSHNFTFTSYSSIFSTLVALLSFAWILISEYSIRKIRHQVLPDKLALKEVLQLLREVHGTIAEREDWSILKRAEFRIRLSRFDLSEKKKSVFNFFS